MSTNHNTVEEESSTPGYIERSFVVFHGHSSDPAAYLVPLGEFESAEEAVDCIEQAIAEGATQLCIDVMSSPV